jgi:hypothetical protein
MKKSEVFEKVKMAGPLPVCIKVKDGWYHGHYYTIPNPEVGGRLGDVKVRDQHGHTQTAWIRPESGVKGLARILLWELWREANERQPGLNFTR